MPPVGAGAGSWSATRRREHGRAVGVCGEKRPHGGRVHGPRRDVRGDAAGRRKRAAERAAERLTQIGRGLRELGIGWIPAYSPQAKGRVERSFGTAQDRLVKHLRLAQVSTLEEANTFLEAEYWPEWNERFARPLNGSWICIVRLRRRSIWRCVEPRRAARHRQRLHLFLRRAALPDRAPEVRPGCGERACESNCV